MNRTSVISGVFLIVIAIMLGAFGAHALKAKLEPEQILAFEVGVRYQMYHGLALLAIGFGAGQLNFSLKAFTWIILTGVLLFSGSIYLLSMKDLIGAKLSFLGPITPLGGSLLILAWIIFLVNFIRKSKSINGTQ